MRERGFSACASPFRWWKLDFLRRAKRAPVAEVSQLSAARKKSFARAADITPLIPSSLDDDETSHRLEVCQEFNRGPFTLMAHDNCFATRSSLARLRHGTKRIKSAASLLLHELFHFFLHRALPSRRRATRWGHDQLENGVGEKNVRAHTRARFRVARLNHRARYG